MKLKHLESALSSLQRDFPSPNILLEQYATSAQLTASVILTALNNGDIGPGMTALDLGCGTGMLTIGCALVECDHVLALDCDAEALEIARNNTTETDLEDRIDFILAKVRELGEKTEDLGGGGSNRNFRGQGKRSRTKVPAYPAPPREPSIGTRATATNDKKDGIPLRSNCVDTVLTNPPFGTKHNAGIDVRFLQTATRLARRAVYSFHKSSTRDYLIRKIKNDWDLDVEVVAQMRFDIKNMYKFHQKKSVDIDVDLLRILIPENEIGSDSSSA